MDKQTRLTPIDPVIGRNIKALRLCKRMSQQDMATLMGVTFQQLQKYERGINRLPAAKIYMLHLHFEIPLDYFFTGCERQAIKTRKTKKNA